MKPTLTPQEKADLFRSAHLGPEPLILPNAWDAASARVLVAEGYSAVATSSSGCAAVLGYPDGQHIPRGEMMMLLGRIAKTVDVPVSADVEAGYDDPVKTALDVIAAGAIGLNLEDMAGGVLQSIEEQTKIIAAVREAARGAGVNLVINARTDIYLAQNGDESTRFERTVERLNAYRAAGADCLFAPGVKDGDTIGRLVKALNGPLNVLAVPGSPSIVEMKNLGVARVSFGGGPSRLALGAVRRFMRELRAYGTFGTLANEAIPSAELQKLLSQD